MAPPDLSRQAHGSDSLYRGVFEHARDAMFLADDDARIVDVNPAACALLGYSRDELLERVIWDVTPPGALEDARRVWAAIASGGHLQGDSLMLRKEGTTVPVEFNAVANVWPGVHLTTNRDTSERCRQTDLLKTSEHKYRNLIAHAPLVLFAIDASGRFTVLEGMGLDAAGLKPGQVVGLSAYDLYGDLEIVEHSGQTTNGSDMLRRVFGGETVVGTTELNGRFFENSFLPTRDASGAIDASRDITGRERGYAESRLLQEVTWRIAGAADADAALASVMRIACDTGDWVYAEAWRLADDGVSLEQLPVWHAADPRFESFRDETFARMALGAGIPGQVWTEKRPVWIPDVVEAENFLRRELARAAGLHAALAVPITLDDQGTVTAVLILYAAGPQDPDVRLVRLFSAVGAQLGAAMHRKQAEGALRASEGLLHLVVTSAPVVLFALDQDGVFTLSEGKGLEGLGLQPGQVVGKSAYELYQNVAGFTDFVERALRGETFVGVTEMEGRWFDTWYSPRVDANGAVIGVLAVATDVTERRQLEDKLRQAQKLESLGLLAGGIAHDFNNILTAITGYAELVGDRLPPDGEAREEIGEVIRASEKAALLTYQLLAFSRKQLLRPETLSLNDVVADVGRMLRRVIGEDIALVINMADGIGLVSADPGQLAQVILNLAVNARDAMPRGGTLTIETAGVELDDDAATALDSLVRGSYVRLTVTDTGIGMSPEVSRRIFEPFFTTKAVGKGTGMGLATVYGIVKQSGGHVAVSSDVGRGATFSVYFPIMLDGEPSVAVPVEDAPFARGTETVLLVEDEEVVRRLARRALQSCGYAVLEAEDGAAALALSSDSAAKIDLLITDVVMPKMSGRELVEHLAVTRPELKILYMSGYTDDAVVRRDVVHEATQFLQKPFSMRGLARKVRDVLDA